MSEHEKETIREFMTLVLYKLHPHFDEYPMQDMEEVHDGKGVNFFNTEYEHADELQNAFFINRCLQQL